MTLTEAIPTLVVGALFLAAAWRGGYNAGRLDGRDQARERARRLGGAR